LLLFASAIRPVGNALAWSTGQQDGRARSHFGGRAIGAPAVVSISGVRYPKVMFLR
jgi:hypothetical protein